MAGQTWQVPPAWNPLLLAGATKLSKITHPDKAQVCPVVNQGPESHGADLASLKKNAEGQPYHTHTHTHTHTVRARMVVLSKDT